MVTVGLLYPGHSAEDDYPALEARLDGSIRLPVVITSVGEDAHRVDALLDLGRAERLAEGASELAAEQPAPDRVIAMVRAADHPDAEAILVPDTAMHTLEIVDDLEAAIGKPVLTANQVTVWKGLDLLGPVPSLPSLGSLFSSRGTCA